MSKRCFIQKTKIQFNQIECFRESPQELSSPLTDLKEVENVTKVTVFGQSVAVIDPSLWSMPIFV